MQRPSCLIKAEPYNALCLHFNVAPPQFTEEIIPSTFTMRVTNTGGTLPTHILAATVPDTNANGEPSSHIPFMLPISGDLYRWGFRELEDIASPTLSGASSPTLHHPTVVVTGPNGQCHSSDTLAISLPVVSISVPHLASLPLLLLFGMGLESHTASAHLLTSRLLPSQVVEEFPNASTMAHILARARSQEQFDRIFWFNQGLWRNILALGLKNTKVVELVRMAWNVTAEARRIRQRAVVATI